MQNFISIRRRGWSRRIPSLPLLGFFLFLSFFLSFLVSSRAQVAPVNRFWRFIRHVGLIDVFLCKEVPFGSRDERAPYLGDQIPLKKNKFLNSNISFMFSQYGELQPTNGWEIGWPVWGTPAIFNDVAQRRSTKVCTILVRLYYIFIIWGFCPLTEFCQVQNSLCVQGLRSPILAALLLGACICCRTSQVANGTAIVSGFGLSAQKRA